ncbi:MAG: cytochrome-c peroxidase [endosymbiont of Galathealinum brachiosum]|uniref:Cytochrome-c peroxidase n=1 Tax=endosymbiont of Galathealinum brachiosum TaxID=2200906 RepID=A0A370DD58_9GAMM|nr:MAG: cytochrome-c peroxidase [endosymbiont of Galathealinum brachiosum]
MTQLKQINIFLTLLLTVSLFACDTSNTSDSLSLEKQQLGKQIFFDTNLSTPPGQACSSCHLPSAGFADPDREIPVSRGVHPDRFGNRNTPTAAYSSFSPEFHLDTEEGIFFGGQFLDGRSATLEDQAKQPFLNPVEMANADATSVVEKVSNSDYASDFKAIYGETIFNDVDLAFDKIADAIASFERSKEVSPFSSKFDAFIAGDTNLTIQEIRGLDLFNRQDKGNCAACHPSTNENNDIPALFTDFSFDNLGTPANPVSPFLSQDLEFNPDGANFIDFGLGGELADISENGKFKVPTLRNISITGPYMHNGVFNTLEEVLDFYNERNNDGVIPEVANNVNTEELGNLGLSAQEKNDIIAFLKTLTDGYNNE